MTLISIFTYNADVQRQEAENYFALSVSPGRFHVRSRGHPEDEGQQDGQQEGAGGHGSEVEEQTHSHHRRHLGNTPTQQQLPHCLAELRREDVASSAHGVIG